MNLKKFFYQDYFFHSFNDENGRHHKISLKKSEDKKKRDKISEKNEPAFKDANRELTGYILAAPASDLLDFQKQSRKSVHSFPLVTTYPGLFTGSGYNHETGSAGELKLGFFFDHTSGLPVLPGSSVKGVLRSVFPQCKKSEANPMKPVFSEDKTKAMLQKNKANFIGALFGMPKDSFALVHRLELAIFEGVDVEKTEAECSKARVGNKPDPDKILYYLPMTGHDIFLDSFISKGNDEGKILGTDALTPHFDDPLKNPIPLPFLKVLPEVTFTFQFLLNDSKLNEQTTITANRKKDAFYTILETFGIGAKTNVGYGQFLPDDTDAQKVDLSSDISSSIGRTNKNSDAPPLPPPAQPEPEYIELTNVKIRMQVNAKVLDNQGGKLKLQLMINDYTKDAEVSYGASERFPVDSTVKVTVANIQGRGPNQTIIVNNPQPL